VNDKTGSSLGLIFRDNQQFKSNRQILNMGMLFKGEMAKLPRWPPAGIPKESGDNWLIVRWAQDMVIIRRREEGGGGLKQQEK
jgi:hypothetical protein